MMLLSPNEVMQRAVLGMYSYDSYVQMCIDNHHVPVPVDIFRANHDLLTAKMRSNASPLPLPEGGEYRIEALVEGIGDPGYRGVYATVRRGKNPAAWEGRTQKWNGDFWTFYANSWSYANSQTGRSVEQTDAVHWYGLQPP